MGGRQQKIQRELAFMSSAEVKPTALSDGGTEPSAAGSKPESHAGNSDLLCSTNRLGTDPYAGWCGRGGSRGFPLSRSGPTALGGASQIQSRNAARVKRNTAPILLRRVAAYSITGHFQGRWPWLNYGRTFGAEKPEDTMTKIRNAIESDRPAVWKIIETVIAGGDTICLRPRYAPG